MMTMYDVIKMQWNAGCYTDKSQLQIFVDVGYITQEQLDEITAPKSATTEPVDGVEAPSNPTVTA